MIALALSLAALQLPPGPVETEEQACRAATAIYALHYRLPESSVSYCDHSVSPSAPRDFYVLALRSHRECRYICSNLMGWFGVERSTGRVFWWDVGEDVPGEEVSVAGSTVDPKLSATKFQKLACELGCDEDEAAFGEAVKRIVVAPPDPDGD